MSVCVSAFVHLQSEVGTSRLGDGRGDVDKGEVSLSSGIHIKHSLVQLDLHVQSGSCQYWLQVH